MQGQEFTHVISHLHTMYIYCSLYLHHPWKAEEGKGTFYWRVLFSTVLLVYQGLNLWVSRDYTCKLEVSIGTCGFPNYGVLEKLLYDVV